MVEDSKSCCIPVVDFRAFSIAHEDVPDVTNPEVQQLVKGLYSACSTLGFVYLTNHGIPQDEIDNALHTIANFFALKPDVKSKYKKLDPKLQFGWDEFEGQRTSPSPDTPNDLKESFDVSKKAFDTAVFKFPDDVLPDLKPTLQSFFNRVKQLSARVLTALALSLDVNPEIFISAYKELHNAMLRFIYYPKLNDVNIKPGQLRCGEHSDFALITLLFQDDAGGLEIATENGTFIPVTPIPGTVLVNIADLMQRWTSDRFKSVVHRVIVPEEQLKKQKSRQSIAFFVHADDETIVSCLDGSNKYPPINAWEYVLNLIENSYKY